jgi:hypothetical protein
MAKFMKKKKFTLRMKYPDGHETIEDAELLTNVDNMLVFDLFVCLEYILDINICITLFFFLVMAR